jgi:hypothetical protein
MIVNSIDGKVKSSSAYVARHPQSLRRTLNVRLIPSDLHALHLKLFTLPSGFRPFYEFIIISYSG